MVSQEDKKPKEVKYGKQAEDTATIALSCNGQDRTAAIRWLERDIERWDQEIAELPSWEKGTTQKRKRAICTQAVEKLTHGFKPA